MLYTLGMRTKLLILALVLLTAVAIGGVVGQYQKYTNQQAQQERQAAQKLAADKAAQQAEQNGFVARYNALYAECQKGVVAYGLLPLTTRNKTVQPSCGELLSN